MSNTKKHITIQFTPKELMAVVDGLDTVSGMTGGYDEETEQEIRNFIKSFDKALLRSGYKRKHN